MTRIEAIADWHAKNPNAGDAHIVVPYEQLAAYAAAIRWVRERGGKRLKAQLEKCEVS